MRKFCTSIFFFVLSIAAFAEEANPEPLRIVQPDGSVLTIQLHGDEFYNYTTTLDGYRILKCSDNFYRYALDETRVSNIVAHDAEKRSLEEKNYCLQLPLLTSPEQQQLIAARRAVAAAPHKLKGKFDRSKFRGLVILCNYNDLSFCKSGPLALFNQMVNQRNYTGYQDQDEGWQSYTGSVRDYFYDSSMGTFDPEFDVVGPITINYSQYYANGTSNAKDIILAALKAADPLVDYSKYDGDGDGRVDMFYVIFAGYSASSSGNDSRLLWPHASTLTASKYNSLIYDGVRFNRYACSTEKYGWNTATRHDNVLCGVGTMCHEFSHVLGLHDHYDTDGNGTIVPGSWDVMSNGNHNNKGRTPPAYNLYERFYLDMAEPEVINSAGSYTLPELTQSNKGYHINSGVETEYFLFENRQKTKWDASHAGKGMLVWRVDTSDQTKWDNNDVNTDPDHPLFELIRATPSWGNIDHTSVTNSGGDPFPGTGSVSELTNTTSASLLSWNGTDCPVTIHNIKQSSGTITFTAEVGLASTTQKEDFSNMTSFTTTAATQKQGRYTEWTFTNGGVTPVSGYNNLTGNACVLYQGGSLSTTFSNHVVEMIQYSVANGGKSNSLVRLETSADGISWTQFGVNKMLTAGTEAVIEHQTLNLPAGNHFRILFYNGLSNQPVYIDNITVTLSEDVSPVQSVFVEDKSAGSSIFNLSGQKVTDNYKGIIIQSGKKLIR